MGTLYVMEQGCKLRKVGLRVRVEKEGERLAEIPLIKVDRVVVYGNVTLTNPLMSYLLREGLTASFLDIKGRAKGELRPLFSPSGELRKRQYALALNRDKCLDICKKLVQGKIRNQRTLLLRYHRRKGLAELERVIDHLWEVLEWTEDCVSLEELRGLEGNASSVYFGALRLLVPEELGFKARCRRPPKDPVNAMLSLGYSLLMSNVMGAIESHGLDPYIGYLHSDRYGKPSLALDMMEEWRPVVVDSLVLGLVNRNEITHYDFVEEEGSIRFQDQAARRFISRYNDFMYHRFLYPGRKEEITVLEALQLQVARLCRFIQHDEPYEPYLIR